MTYLAVIPDKEVLVLVMDDLDKLVSDPLEHEEGSDVVEVGQMGVQLRDRVMGHAQICADAIRPENNCKGFQIFLQTENFDCLNIFLNCLV